MTDRVMGCQSFLGASTPADAVFKSVKSRKGKGKESTWWWTCFAVVLMACGSSRVILSKLRCKLCGTKFGPANPSGTAKSHCKPGVCKKYSKAVAKEGKLQPFNKTLSNIAALIKENSSPTIQHVNAWRQWASKHGFPALATMAVRLLCMHLTACASERNWSVWGQLYTKHHSRLALNCAQKLICIQCNN